MNNAREFVYFALSIIILLTPLFLMDLPRPTQYTIPLYIIYLFVMFMVLGCLTVMTGKPFLKLNGNTKRHHIKIRLINKLRN